MQIPGAERAVVEPAKVRDYLLSDVHPVGRFKARFFGALGYTRQDWPALVASLRQFARQDAVLGQASAFGQKYEVHGNLTGLNGRTVELVAVWIVLAGEDFPRFVTAHPGAKQ